MENNSKPEPSASEAPQKAPAAKNPRLEKLLATMPEVRMVMRGGRHVLFLPQLGLHASGKDLQAAYQSLLEARRARLEELAAEDLLHLIPDEDTAAAVPDPPSLLSRLKPFLAKAAVTTVLVMFVLSAISEGLRDMGYGLEKKLEGLSNWSPEQVEWHRARARKIAEKLGPVLRELRVMFDAPQTGAAPAGADKTETAKAAPPGQTPQEGK